MSRCTGSKRSGGGRSCLTTTTTTSSPTIPSSEGTSRSLPYLSYLPCQYRPLPLTFLWLSPLPLCELRCRTTRKLIWGICHDAELIREAPNDFLRYLTFPVPGSLTSLPPRPSSVQHRGSVFHKVAREDERTGARERAPRGLADSQRVAASQVRVCRAAPRQPAADRHQSRRRSLGQAGGRGRGGAAAAAEAQQQVVSHAIAAFALAAFRSSRTGGIQTSQRCLYSGTKGPG